MARNVFKSLRAQTAEMLTDQLNKELRNNEGITISLIEFDQKVRVWIAIILVSEATNVQ